MSSIALFRVVLDDLFGGSAFEDLHFGRQPGLLQAERQGMQVGFRFDFANFPIQRIHRAAPPRPTCSFHHMQGYDLGFEGAGEGNGMGQHALCQGRAIQGKEDSIEHRSLLSNDRKHLTNKDAFAHLSGSEGIVLDRF